MEESGQWSIVRVGVGHAEARGVLLWGLCQGQGGVSRRLAVLLSASFVFSLHQSVKGERSNE